MIKVIAAPGTKCPKEGKPREYITDQEATDVPETTYYRRLLGDGSLIVSVEKKQNLNAPRLFPLNANKREAKDGK